MVNILYFPLCSAAQYFFRFPRVGDDLRYVISVADFDASV